mmetsp:Transcript_22766/g.47405  ORF Transcript_22766/g.47405 Transcript_22766/m.47405 type:complete len:204 (-) Transcript_22766:70-681(-)
MAFLTFSCLLKFPWCSSCLSPVDGLPIECCGIQCCSSGSSCPFLVSSSRRLGFFSDVKSPLSILFSSCLLRCTSPAFFISQFIGLLSILAVTSLSISSSLAFLYCAISTRFSFSLFLLSLSILALSSLNCLRSALAWMAFRLRSASSTFCFAPAVTTFQLSNVCSGGAFMVGGTRALSSVALSSAKIVSMASLGMRSRCVMIA